MMPSPRALLARIPESRDLMVAAVLLLAVTLMILPMPTAVVDVVIGLNFGLAILLVLTAIYLKNPLDFSTLPGVILIATILRLSLSITTTRLILSEGDAGAIIRTFGEFVIAGSVVVGMVVFFIITVVQLVVISKGSERVAEVGARFTLDAMPGKQMAIDADLRNGDIDQAEARMRRVRLSRESQLYGAMDGAMKFVKGDAMAGIVIILVNLIGGLAIGVAQRGLPIGEAMREYSLLTVGDALISQIPALLISLAASVVVTRVASDGDDNLGRDIALQLSGDHRALFIAASLLFAMAFLPGFPTLTIIAISSLFAGLGMMRLRALQRLAVSEEKQAEDDALPATEDDAAEERVDREGDGRIALRVPTWMGEKEADRLHAMLGRTQASLVRKLGLELPSFGVRLDDPAPPGSDPGDPVAAVEIDGVPVRTFEVPEDRVWLDDDPRQLDLADIAHEVLAPADRPARSIVARLQAANDGAARAIGLDPLDPARLCERVVVETVRARAGEFLGIQEARALLEKHGETYGDLVKEVVRTSSIQRIAEVLRRLLDERVPLTNIRAIMEALAEWSERERDAVLLTEYVRAALKRQICHDQADARRTIPVLLVAHDIEERVRGALRETSVGTYLVLDEATSERIIGAVRRHIERAAKERDEHALLGHGAGATARDAPFALLTTLDVRRYLRSLLMRNDLDVPVLSHQEIAKGYSALPIGSLDFNRQATAAIVNQEERRTAGGALETA